MCESVTELVLKLSFAAPEGTKLPPRHKTGYYSKAAYVYFQGERRDWKLCCSPNSQLTARSKDRMPNWIDQISIYDDIAKSM